MLSPSRLLFAVLFALTSSVALAQQPEATLPVIFHVARDSAGRPVADEAFTDAAIARANEIFAPLAVQFTKSATTELSAAHAELVTRTDRDALLPYVTLGAIHCMVVASLMDIDEPGRVRRGVHWYAHKKPRPHLVILSAIADPRVLAHELGHYLGLPEHRQIAGNVMSYLWGDGTPIFDPDQAERVRRTVRRMRTKHEL